MGLHPATWVVVGAAALQAPQEWQLVGIH